MFMMARNDQNKENSYNEEQGCLVELGRTMQVNSYRVTIANMFGRSKRSDCD